MIKKIDISKIRNDQIPHEVMTTVIPRLNEVIDALNQTDELPSEIPSDDILRSAGIRSVGTLKSISDLTTIRGIGETRAKEIEEWLDANA